MDEEFQDEEVFEVDKILSKRIQGGPRSFKTEYLVKWKGYALDDATWEPQANLKGCSKLIKQYEAFLIRESDAGTLNKELTFDESNITISVLFASAI
jgi:hypothetical protein